MKRHCITLLMAAAMLSSSNAEAYEGIFTHRWITRQAVHHLAASMQQQTRDVLLQYEDALAAGAEHEDDYFLDGDTDPLTMRSARHFFRPHDGAGLTHKGRTYQSSWEWGGRENPNNDWDWQDALDHYAAGRLEEAYFALGHVVHLIQDTTVPAHTHLDQHGPPAGDDFEMYCWFRMQSEYESSLPTPAATETVPRFDNLERLWKATAQASYWRNMYPGALSGEESATGVIAEMFPDLHWSWFAGLWTISTPPVGDQGSGFIEEEPGWFYVRNAEHAALLDKPGLDVNTPRADEVVLNTDNRPMVEFFARDLVPLAILHTAAALELFERTASALRPSEPTSDPAADLQPDPHSSGCSANKPGAGGTYLVAFAVLLLFRARARVRRA